MLKDKVMKYDHVIEKIATHYKEHAKGFWNTSSNDDDFKTLSKTELKTMAEFILANDISEDDPVSSFNLSYSKQITPQSHVQEKTTEYENQIEKEFVIENAPDSTCPNCNAKMNIMWGDKYKSYYWHCNSCMKNVSINIKCPNCSNKLKLSKCKNEYMIKCDSCGAEGIYHSIQ